VPVFDGAELDFAELAGRRSADPFTGKPGEPVSVRVVEIPPGPRTPHRHPHSCEVVYVADGTGRVWEGDASTDVAAGDIVVIPAGVPHATVCLSRRPLRLVCFFPYPDLGRNLEELTGPERR
jgi:quercetin dioxygenase-like cupin family protein